MNIKLISIILLILILQSGGKLYSQQNNTGQLINHKLRNADNGDIIIGTYAFILAVTVNPELLFENKKFYFGLTREITLGFGKIAEYRVSGEYTYIFRDSLKHHLRVSAKYDILSKRSESEWLRPRVAFSIGAGYFRDGNGDGIFPEVTAGYRFDESKYILYPYVKLRHTFMLTKNKPGITDLSLGMIMGLKPF